MALPMPDPIDAFAATLLPIGQAPASPPPSARLGPLLAGRPHPTRKLRS